MRAWLGQSQEIRRQCTEFRYFVARGFRFRPSSIILKVAKRWRIFWLGSPPSRADLLSKLLKKPGCCYGVVAVCVGRDPGAPVAQMRRYPQNWQTNKTKPMSEGVSFRVVNRDKTKPIAERCARRRAAPSRFDKTKPIFGNAYWLLRFARVPVESGNPVYNSKKLTRLTRCARFSPV